MNFLMLVAFSSPVQFFESVFVVKFRANTNCQCIRSLISYMAQLLSPENEHNLCLFARLSNNIIQTI